MEELRKYFEDALKLNFDDLVEWAADTGTATKARLYLREQAKEQRIQTLKERLNGDSKSTE